MGTTWPCGRRDQENTVTDWLRNLGEEHEESTRLWHELATIVAGFAHNMPVMKEEPLEKFRVMLFGLLYDGYDCDKPFTPQIRSRQQRVNRRALHECRKEQRECIYSYIQGQAA